MSKKNIYYDIEIIIDYDKTLFQFNQNAYISTHRMIRGLTLDELYKLLKSNEEISEDIHIVINIRGAN